MQRRTFISQTAMAAGALAISPSCKGFGLSKPNPKGPAIGLQLYTVRGEINKGLDPLLKKISEFGYTHIETYGYADGKYFGKTVKEFRDLLYENNLLAPSGHYNMAEFLKGDDDAWKDACAAANTLEHEYIVCPSIDQASRPKDMDGYTKLAERMNAAGKISKEAGLQFGYHNHDFEFKYDSNTKTSLYEQLLQKTDPALVKMEMDIYWVAVSDGDPVSLFYQNPDRFPLWHVKDMNPQTRKNIDVGSGSIDFKAIFDHKKESGMKYFFIEQENYDVSPLDSIEKSIAYVKKELVS